MCATAQRYRPFECVLRCVLFPHICQAPCAAPQGKIESHYIHEKRHILPRLAVFPQICLFFYILCMAHTCTDWNQGMPISISIRMAYNKNPNFPQSYMGGSEHSSSFTPPFAPSSNPPVNFSMQQGRLSTAPHPVAPSTLNPMNFVAQQAAAAFGIRQAGYPPQIPGQDQDMGFARIQVVRPGSAPLPMGLTGPNLAMGGMQGGQNPHALMNKKRQQDGMLDESDLDQMKRQRIENGQMAHAQPKTFAQQQQMFHQQLQQKAAQTQQTQEHQPGRSAQHGRGIGKHPTERHDVSEEEAHRVEQEELQKRQQELRKLLQEQLKAKQQQQGKTDSHASSNVDSSTSSKSSQSRSAVEGAHSKQSLTAQSASKSQGKQSMSASTSSSALTSDSRKRAAEDARTDSAAAGSKVRKSTLFDVHGCGLWAWFMSCRLHIMYIFVYLLVCMHACMYTYTYTYMHTIHTCIHTYI
jgi:hypothetical protein